jgi:hypothetical protein
MNWTPVATAAVSLLIPYLQEAGKAAAKKVGEALPEKIGAIRQAIQSRFERDKDQKGLQTLGLFCDDPQTFESALIKLVAEKAAADPSFGEQLQKLVSEVQETAPGSIQVSGDGAVATTGGVAAGKGGIAAGRDAHIGSRPKE